MSAQPLSPASTSLCSESDMSPTGQQINDEAIKLAQQYSRNWAEDLEISDPVMKCRSGLKPRDTTLANQLIAAATAGEVSSKSALSQKIMRSMSKEEKEAYALKADPEKAKFRFAWAEKDCDSSAGGIYICIYIYIYMWWVWGWGWWW